MLLKTARKLVIGVIGATVLLLSIVGYIMPIIPGIPLTFLGLAILATEFVWAKRLLRKAKRQAKSVFDSVRSKVTGAEATDSGPREKDQS